MCQEGLWRLAEQCNYFSKMRSPPVLPDLRIVAVEQASALERVPCLGVQKPLVKANFPVITPPTTQSTFQRHVELAGLIDRSFGRRVVIGECLLFNLGVCGNGDKAPRPERLTVPKDAGTANSKIGAGLT